ncbi:MAG TPA: peptidoglycan-associated lipoprotein Pal [Thermoanaerobaculia bacterium]|nr:peptidoglycan-associated lipoprotein Pal [Thermoanaerobaculia bacterium]
MKKTTQLILTSLALVLLIVSPACRTKKDIVTTPTTTTTMAAPEIEPPPPLPVETPVEDRRDFVQETTPREEVLPSDIEELNRVVQRQGYLRDVFYNYDEATLDDAAQTALSASANWLKGSQGAGYSLLIEGHCDERGTEQYNLALGDKRANAAKDYLVTLGVEAGRVRTVSYGEERPFEEGHDDASWAQNRRAHLVLVK